MIINDYTLLQNDYNQKYQNTQLTFIVL